MSSIDSPSSRKRPAPSEREESWHVDHPVKRSKTYSAGEIATDLASTVIRGLSLVKETMADWLLTPRRDYHSLYNVRRRDDTGRRVLTQGHVTTRPGATEWTRLSDAPDRISDGMLSFKPLNDQSKLKVESFRFGSNGSANGTTSHMNGGHRPLPPSEKFGRRRTDDSFKEYTSMGPRLFAKATRKMKYYGATADRVRNLEEKNNYARLLATLRNDDFTGAALFPDRSSQQPVQKRRPSDDVIITGVDTPQHNVTSRSTASIWEPVEDSLLYIRTSKNRNQPHSLKPWNSRTRIAAKFNRLPRNHSTPDKSRSSNQSFGFDVRNGSTNHSEESSHEQEQRLDASFGLSNFVNRLRHGLDSKKPLSDLFPNDVTDSIVTSPVTSLTPKSKTSRIKKVIDLATEGKEEKNDDVVLVLSDDDEDDDVQVELEELSPKKHGPTRGDSPLLPELIMEPARRESRTNSTCSNDDLQRRLRSIPYADASWIRLQRQESDTKAEAFLRSRVEAEMEIKAFKDARLKQSEQLEEAIKRKLRIAELVPAVLEEPEEEEEEEELYPELTQEMENMVDSALYGGPGSEVLVDHMRIQIRRSDVKTLEGTTWLNDEVINFHMNLLIQRGQEEGRPKVHAFNTFFYQKLVQDGHVSLKRWTRKIDVFAMDYLVVPVHLQMHWCMAIVDFRKKEIRYYDSMGGQNNTCLSAIRGYLEEESVDKKKQKYDTSSWKLINAKGPQQMNGSDCGVFSTICAEHVTRDAPLTYSQDLMPYFRRRMVYEIITKKLMQ